MKNAVENIVSEIDNRNLVINYNCKTDHVLFSIADFTGNVMMRGDCHEVVDNTLDISSLPEGMYMLCIIDGDSLIKARFQKN